MHRFAPRRPRFVPTRDNEEIKRRCAVVRSRKEQIYAITQKSRTPGERRGNTPKQLRNCSNCASFILSIRVWNLKSGDWKSSSDCQNSLSGPSTSRKPNPIGRPASILTRALGLRSSWAGLIQSAGEPMWLCLRRMQDHWRCSPAASLIRPRNRTQVPLHACLRKSGSSSALLLWSSLAQGSSIEWPATPLQFL